MLLHIEAEVILVGFARRDMALLLPGLVGIVPKVLIEADAVHRLMPQNALHPFLACHVESLLFVLVSLYPSPAPGR